MISLDAVGKTHQPCNSLEGGMLVRQCCFCFLLCCCLQLWQPCLRFRPSCLCYCLTSCRKKRAAGGESYRLCTPCAMFHRHMHSPVCTFRCWRHDTGSTNDDTCKAMLTQHSASCCTPPEAALSFSSTCRSFADRVCSAISALRVSSVRRLDRWRSSARSVCSDRAQDQRANHVHTS